MSKVVTLFPGQPRFGVQPRARSDSRMDVESFKLDLVRPVLKVTNMWSMAAEQLIVGTALAESGLRFVTQLAGGPGLSFMQIEPKSYYDVIEYLAWKHELKSRVLSACYMEIFPDHTCLTWNLRLSILIARLIYWRRPEPLPSYGDVAGMSQYWKDFYNSSLGKGTVEHYIQSWEAGNENS